MFNLLLLLKQKLALFITSLVLTSGLGATSLPVKITEYKPQIIRTEYVNIFKNKTTGKIIEVKITKREYDKLALKGARQPTYPNSIWLYSAGGIPIYATSTILKDNEYIKNATSTPQTYRVKLNGIEKTITEIELNKLK